MLGVKSNKVRSRKEDGEKPFWISFSDLMTSLMVLFLVSMAVSLTVVTREIKDAKKGESDRQDSIQKCMVDVYQVTRQFPGVEVRRNSVEFGVLADFEHDRDNLTAVQERHIRGVVRKVLEVARSRTCDRWLKRVVVEGFASQTGTYLHNLDLSFRRSQRVLCVLLNPGAGDALTIQDRKDVRRLFLAGGSSFNTEPKSEAQMRRVELKLEFRELGSEKDLRREMPWDDDANCPNDSAR